MRVRAIRSVVVNQLKRSPIALRAEVIRQSRVGYQPEERQNPFRRTGRLGILQDAIEFRQQVQFQYSNEDEPRRTGRRVGNPHGIFSKNGRAYLLMYTLPGSTTGSGRLPGWRTFILNRIKKPQIMEQVTLPGQPLRQFPIAPGFARWRRTRFTFRV